MNYKGSTYITEERIKLAGDEKKDRLYEPKQNQKAIKVLTVAAYVLCVSLAAIMLSFYYIFIWNSSTKPSMIQPRAITCDKIVIPDGLEKLLANASEISLETFLKNYSMRFKLDHEKIKMIQIQEIKHFPHIFERLEQQATITNSISNNNNNNKENSIDLIAPTTPLPFTATEQPFNETESTSSPGSSIFLSDSPIIVPGSSSSSISSSSPSGLLLKKLKQINQQQQLSHRKNNEIDENGDADNENGDGDDDDGDGDDDDDDDDGDDDDDDTEQEDYYEPSGQKEITEKFITNNRTAKNINQ